MMNRNRHNIFERRGFALLEVMIALAVMAIILAALFSLLFATQQLWTNGFSIAKTSIETRKVYDRMIFSLYQSPNTVAEPMRHDDSDPELLIRVLGEDTVGDQDGFQPALVYASVSGGPLEVDLGGVGPTTTSLTLSVPSADTDHEYVIAQRQYDAGLIDIREGDYLVLTGSSYTAITSSDPKEITSVSNTGTTWNVTISSGFSDLKPTGGSNEYFAVTAFRYNAYVVLEDQQYGGAERDLLVLYEGLEIPVLTGVGQAISNGRPFRARLPDNYLTNYSRVISDSLTPYPFPDEIYGHDEQDDGIRPFYRLPSNDEDGNLNVDWVRVRLAIDSGQIAEVVEIGDMSRLSNFDSRIYLRSGSF